MVNDLALDVVCVGCGWSGSQVCWDIEREFCHWLRIDRNLGAGVCSGCADCVPDWDAGKHDTRTRIGPIDV
ncbi:hypothetical protein ACOTF7_18655 [Achromobacter xylosoxidans]